MSDETEAERIAEALIRRLEEAAREKEARRNERADEFSKRLRTDSTIVWSEAQSDKQ
jgi:hypothetical protein